jgi:hypothetical protein
MTSYQEPLESRYVIELYQDASERWDEFRRSGDAEVLRALAEVLCRGLGRLQEDADFWTTLREIAATTSREDRQAILDQLADFEDFLIHEYGILAEIGSEAFAVRLLGDMTVAVEMVQEWPDERTVQNLQNRLVDLRNIVCEQTEELPLDEGRRGRRFFRGVRIVARTMVFVGGAALCVANLLTAHGVVHVAPSVIKGAGAMERATSGLGNA